MRSKMLGPPMRLCATISITLPGMASVMKSWPNNDINVLLARSDAGDPH